MPVNGHPDDWGTLRRLPPQNKRIPVKGDSSAKTLEEDPTMRTWTRVAVITVHGVQPYRVGFRNAAMEHVQYSRREVTLRRVGLRVGPENVDFYIISSYSGTSVTTEGPEFMTLRQALADPSIDVR